MDKEWNSSKTLYHLHLPRILLGYIQLFMNFFFACAIVISVCYFMYVVHKDIKIKIDSHGQIISAQVRSCLNSFQENQCEHVSSRVPALQKLCSEWEICMSKSPTDVVTLQVFAEMLSETVNKALDPLSYKVLGFLMVMLLSLIYFNIHFGNKLSVDGAAAIAAHRPSVTKNAKRQPPKRINHLKNDSQVNQAGRNCKSVELAPVNHTISSRDAWSTNSTEKFLHPILYSPTSPPKTDFTLKDPRDRRIDNKELLKFEQSFIDDVIMSDPEDLGIRTDSFNLMKKYQ